MSTTYRSNGTGIRLDQEQDERGLGQIVGDLTRHAKELVNGEVMLAKRELADNARSVAVPAAMGAGAAVFGLVALVLLGHTIASALGEAMDPWAAYLITTVLYLVAAGALGFACRAASMKTKVATTDTMHEAKEDLTWIRAHTR